MSMIVATGLISAESFNLEQFVKTKLIKNRSVKVLGVRTIGEKALKEHGDWKAYMILIDTKIGGKKQTFPETLLVNEKDGVVALSLLDAKSGKDIAREISPDLPESYYDKKHLILGNPNAKNKVVVFSDPQCPFCKDFMPKIIKDVKNNPDKIALYYYHMPLLRLHPASKTITKAMEYLQQQGKTEDALKLYNLKINSREKNEKKILDAINKQFNMNLTLEQINSKEVKDALADDKEKATQMMVRGTPTVYFNGKFDRSRNEYKKALK